MSVVGQAPSAHPMVSIVVPCYNARRWIGETLASTRQDCPWLVELIVVDDGSTDGSGELVARDFPEARLVRTENRGCSAARSHGTEFAQGTFIKYLDSDDLLAAGSLVRQVDLAESSRAEVVYGNWQRLVQSGEAWQPGEVIERTWQSVHADIEVAFFTGMWCPTGAYLWRSEFLRQRHPGWHSALPVIQDARFALDAARAGATFVHDEALAAHYRTHTSGSVATNNPVKFARDCWHSALELRDQWERAGTFNAARRVALLEVLEYLAFDTYPRDRALARDIVKSARNVAPDWRPTGSRWRRWVGGVVGFEAVARLRQGLEHCRRLRRDVAA
ncbi:MAG: glycosyltransferase [Acidobacteria bacterium]|nr:glycosyltransferase [Acidobacteriota bacterium]